MRLSAPSPSRRAVLAAVLGCLLFLAYLLSFNGIPKASDELWLADTAQSIALRGSYVLNQTQFTNIGRVISDVEPLQPILSAPLYWIGYHLPWAGNLHTLYLFNPLITALTAILLFYYALLLGYRERTALIAALLFGLASMAWPYTRTLFREPLAGLNLLAAAYLWERWRQAFAAGSSRRWWWFAAGAGGTALTLLSKESAVFVLPMLLLIAWPGLAALRRPGRDRTLLIWAGVAMIVAVLVIATVGLSGEKDATEVMPRLVRTFLDGLDWVPLGVGGQLVSPGRGIFWFSPVLLLALASPALLPRARWRESWLILATVLFFAAAYSAVRRDLWFGGAGWGARFMLPLIPMLMLAALPGIDRLLGSPRRWAKPALAALAVIGLTVQIIGVYVDIYDYSDYLQASTGQLPWLGPGIWSVRWSQIIGGLLYMPRSHTDMMWFYKGVDWLALGVLGAGFTALAVLLWRVWRAGEARRWLAPAAGGAILASILLAGFTLWRSLPDPRYKEDTPQIDALRADLEQQAGPQDTVMLSNWHYAYYFMNVYKGRAILWTVSNPPGEKTSPEQQPKVISDNVEDLVGKRIPPVITRQLTGGAFYTGHPLWLVSDASPFLTWANRPVEWYLAKYAYFVSAKDYASNARLVEYLPLRAPSESDTPSSASGAVFGDAIRLVGYDLDAAPAGAKLTALRPGDSLGISLLWEAVGTPAADYTVAIHLIDQSQKVFAQQDRQPVAGFAPTSRWKPGDKIRDNFGLILPADLPAGQYELWVTIYSWPSLDKLSITGSDGKPAGDHVILTTVTVK